MDYKNIPMHKRFDPHPNKEPNLLKENLTVAYRMSRYFLKESFIYLTRGPTIPDWNFGYHTLINSIKQLMISHHYLELPNVPAAQLRSTAGPKVSRNAGIIPDSFLQREKVIDFFKDKCSMVAHAFDKVEIEAEYLYYKKRSKEIVFFVHGGGYVTGSKEMYRKIAYIIAKHSDSTVYAVNYRLSPQNPFPCGLIDCLSGYLHLIETHDHSKVIFMGDSAGGGMILAMCFALREMRLPLPGGLYGISPWIDLTHWFASFRINQKTDFLIADTTDPRLQGQRHYYTSNENLKLGFVSPVWEKNLADLPPMMIQVGGAEKLFDENIYFAQRLSSSDNPPQEIQFEVYESHVHMFEGSRKALLNGAQWIKRIRKHVESKHTHSVYSFKGELVEINDLVYVRKIAVLGSRAVGKSSVTVQFVENHFAETYYPTIENMFTKIVKYKGEEFAVEIMDTAGQDEFSILNSKHAIGMDWVPCVLVANKVDLHAQRQVTTEEGKKKAEEWKCAFIETSAKHNQNISRVFDQMLAEIERVRGEPQAKPSGCTIF
ncbi:GTP-binding protein [Boothiomyces sp. JEL0866]|nr:GTP-binding protein [Boothiomyces sp. JEL0866]